MIGKSHIRPVAAGSLALSLFLIGCGAPPPPDYSKAGATQPATPKKDVSQSTPAPAKGQDAKVVSDQQQAMDLEKGDGGKGPQ